MKKTFAKLISILFGAPVWLAILIILVLNNHLNQKQISILFPILLILQVIIPLGYIFVEYLKNNVTDLDLTKREERYKVFVLTIAAFILSLIATYFLGNKQLLNFFIMIFIILLVNAFITLFWKISLHMTLNTVAVLVVNYLFDWKFPWLFLLIPLVFWSRLTLKKHTIMQLLAALILNGGITIFYLLKFMQIK